MWLAKPAICIDGVPIQTCICTVSFHKMSYCVDIPYFPPNHPVTNQVKNPCYTAIFSRKRIRKSIGKSPHFAIKVCGGSAPKRLPRPSSAPRLGAWARRPDPRGGGPRPQRPDAPPGGCRTCARSGPAGGRPWANDGGIHGDFGGFWGILGPLKWGY